MYFHLGLVSTQATACAYSIIETAKANNLDPYKYLTYIFDYLPGQEINNPKILDIFMPWDDEVQRRCK